MLTLRIALWWIALLAVVVPVNTVVVAVMNGATLQDEFDRLNWAFLSGVTAGPIALMAVGQFTVVVALFATRRIGRARRNAETNAAAWKAFADGERR